MQDILYDYEVNSTTWVYLSSLIIIAVYFKFRRFWSVRNLDLIGLILFAPDCCWFCTAGRSRTRRPVP